jgi:hypothetical protein
MINKEKTEQVPDQTNDDVQMTEQQEEIMDIIFGEDDKKSESESERPSKFGIGKKE